MPEKHREAYLTGPIFASRIAVARAKDCVTRAKKERGWLISTQWSPKSLERISDEYLSVVQSTNASGSDTIARQFVMEPVPLPSVSIPTRAAISRKCGCSVVIGSAPVEYVCVPSSGSPRAALS
jgi:hypothetical protein